MNELTPPYNRFNHISNNIGSPIGLNTYNNTELLQNLKDEKKFKTISHLKQYNNIDNEKLNKISQNLFEEKEKEKFLNNTASNIVENKNEKINYKMKIKSTPKNKKNLNLEDKNVNNNNMINNILSKSSNDMTKFKKEIHNGNNLTQEKNIETNPNKSSDESENLSALAEDLLSMSDEYNVQKMRNGPINKNDFLGESKEVFNIYKNLEINSNNLDNKIINIDSIKPMPKLQTKVYSSPLDKLNLKSNSNYLYNSKNSNKKNYNKLKNNLYNFHLDDVSNKQYTQTQTETQTADNKIYPQKMKNHISSNSISNNKNNQNNINNNTNISKNVNINNTILTNLINKSQVIKKNNNQLGNNIDMFNRTGLNQLNSNYY